jgi:hypothetical protein
MIIMRPINLEKGKEIILSTIIGACIFFILQSFFAGLLTVLMIGVLGGATVVSFRFYKHWSRCMDLEIAKREKELGIVSAYDSQFIHVLAPAHQPAGVEQSEFAPVAPVQIPEKNTGVLPDEQDEIEESREQGPEETIEEKIRRLAGEGMSGNHICIEIFGSKNNTRMKKINWVLAGNKLEDFKTEKLMEKEKS